jgi:ammonia channel protein AmtB
MVTSDPVVQVLAAVLVLAIPVGVAVTMHVTWAKVGVGVTLVASWSSIVSLAVSLSVLTTPDVPAAILDAALASAIAVSLTMVAAHRVGVVGGAVFAGLWSLVVYQPVFVASVGSIPSLLTTVFGAVDVAGAHATHVAAAGSLIALAIVARSRLHRVAPLYEADLRRALAGLALVSLGATAWMLGAERVISAASGRILANALVGLVLGAVVWALVERIAGRPFTPRGLVLGAVMAWGAIGLGAAFLSPMAVAASAVIAVASSAGIVVRASGTPRSERRISIAVIVAVAVGAVVLALLADGFGLAATGSIGGVVAQLGAVLVVSAFAVTLGLLCAGGGMLAATLVERRGIDRTAAGE